MSQIHFWTPKRQHLKKKAQTCQSQFGKYTKGPPQRSKLHRALHFAFKEKIKTPLTSILTSPDLVMKAAQPGSTRIVLRTK